MLRVKDVLALATVFRGEAGIARRRRKRARHGVFQHERERQPSHAGAHAGEGRRGDAEAGSCRNAARFVRARELRRAAECLAAFRENGVPIDHTVYHGITKSVYFYDPDGNRLELYCNVPEEEYRNRRRIPTRDTAGSRTSSRARFRRERGPSRQREPRRCAFGASAQSRNRDRAYVLRGRCRRAEPGRISSAQCSGRGRRTRPAPAPTSSRAHLGPSLRSAGRSP